MEAISATRTDTVKLAGWVPAPCSLHAWPSKVAERMTSSLGNSLLR